MECGVGIVFGEYGRFKEFQKSLREAVRLGLAASDFIESSSSNSVPHWYVGYNH